MRWRRLNPTEQTEANEARLRAWHRKFAFLPHWDEASRTVYWLEFVWCRGTGDYLRWAGRQIQRFKTWEYRGGRECPEVKLPPPGREFRECDDH